MFFQFFKLSNECKSVGAKSGEYAERGRRYHFFRFLFFIFFSLGADVEIKSDYIFYDDI